MPTGDKVYPGTTTNSGKLPNPGGASGGSGAPTGGGGLMSNNYGGGASDNQLRPPPIPVPQYAQQQQPIMNQAAKAKTWQEYMAETQRSQRGYYGGYLA